MIVASKGALRETSQVTVPVAGTPLAFHPMPVFPTVTEVPMLQMISVPGSPYAASFTLGTTQGIRRHIAESITYVPPCAETARRGNDFGHGSHAAGPSRPPGGHGPGRRPSAEFEKLLTTLPADKLTAWSRPSRPRWPPEP